MPLPDLVVQDQTFTTEAVLLDNHLFIKCDFVGSKLVFMGEGPVRFEACRFYSCEWVFDGPAENTLLFLSALNQGLGAEGKKLVKDIFASVLQGSPDAGHLTSPEYAAR